MRTTSHFTQTEDGRIWTGGSTLGYYDGSAWHPVKTPWKAGEIDVNTMQSCSGNGLLIATMANGIFMLKNGEWTQFTVNDGLADNHVRFIKALSNGMILASGQLGLSVFDGISWDSSALPEDLNNYGLITNIEESTDGRIWFQTTKGTIAFYPDRNPPAVTLLSPAETVHHPGDVIFAWQGRDAWQNTLPENLSYSWNTDSEKWTSFTHRNSVQLTAIPPGTHTFQLRVRDTNLNISKPVLHTFTVIPPVYRQTWFLISLTIFILLILFAIYQNIHLKKLRIDTLNHQLEIERIEANRKQELQNLRLRIFTNISHEFRTPLTLIISPLHHLLTQSIPEKYRTTLELIQRNSERLLRLINQLLDMRKLEESELTLNLSHAELKPFLTDITDAFHYSFEKKNITFNLSVPENLQLDFDRDKLDKAVFNLLSNALRFTPDSETISLTAEAKDKTLFLCVEDTGPGIPEHNLPHIFDCFHQASESSAGGTGIGLYMVREYMRLHEGEAKAENTPEGGARITLTMPVRNAQTTEKKPIEPTTVKKKSAAKPVESEEDTVTIPNAPLILVVEDTEDLRTFITNQLKTNYRVLSAPNGKEGFELAKKEIPDLIISDVMMPVMDGLELCNAVRNEELTAHIPLIMLTARSAEEHQLEGLQTGADDYIPKPFNVDILLLKIHNQLETRRRLRERFDVNQSKTDNIQVTELSLTSIDEQFLQKAVAAVENHIDEEGINADTLAEELSVSRTQLYRKIKALTDQSVNIFIRTVRMKRAAQLLKDPGLTISEIALSLGYIDQSYFARCFKKQYNLSASDYREKNI